MKRINIFLIASLIFAIKLMAQHDFNCSSHDLYQHMINTDPDFRKNQAQPEEYTKEFVAKTSANQKTAAATYIIPVVFHVIHTGGTGNISDAQIVDQISIMNKEYPRQQADTSMTPTAFKPIAAPFSVEFRLATIDPSGNCTNGIDRIYSSLANCSYTWDDVKGLSYWPSNKYLNIWLVQTMHYPGDMNCYGGGYSQFPGGPANTDGFSAEQKTNLHDQGRQTRQQLICKKRSYYSDRASWARSS